MTEHSLDLLFWGAQKIKNTHYRFPSHGGFSIGKISQITLNKPKIPSGELT